MHRGEKKENSLKIKVWSATQKKNKQTSKQTPQNKIKFKKQKQKQ